LDRIQEQPASRRAINWSVVDLPLRRVKEQLAAAREAGEYQLVGRQCGEVLIALANAIEGSQPGIEAPQAIALLQNRLPQYVQAAAYKLAQEALALVAATYKKLENKRGAALCVEATRTLISLIAIEGGRDDVLITLADLIARMVSTKKLGASHRITLQALTRSQLAQKPLSTLTSLDIVNHCQLRKDQGISPATINQDVMFMRGVLRTAREEWHLEVSTDALDEAKGLLERLELVGKSKRRTRRPLREELDRLLAYFVESDKSARAKIPMAEITEFAMWSGRRISEICSLEWERVDFENRKYVSSETESFRLLGPVWTIIMRQPRTSHLIFPYNDHSISAKYVAAKKALGINDLRLNDLRLEAALRLKQAGHTVEDIAEVIGRKDLNTLREDLAKAGSFRNDS
jgi:integrase